MLERFSLARAGLPPLPTQTINVDLAAVDDTNFATQAPLLETIDHAASTPHSSLMGIFTTSSICSTNSGGNLREGYGHAQA